MCGVEYNDCGDVMCGDVAVGDTVCGSMLTIIVT